MGQPRKPWLVTFGKRLHRPGAYHSCGPMRSSWTCSPDHRLRRGVCAVAGEGTTCKNRRTSQACWTRATPPRSLLFGCPLDHVGGEGRLIWWFCGIVLQTEFAQSVTRQSVAVTFPSPTCTEVAQSQVNSLLSLQSPVRLSLRCKSCTATLHAVTCRDMRVSEDM